MASTDLSQLLAEYRSYSNRDYSDRNLPELIELLAKFFPSRYKAAMSDPPEYVPRFLMGI